MDGFLRYWETTVQIRSYIQSINEKKTNTEKNLAALILFNFLAININWVRRGKLLKLLKDKAAEFSAKDILFIQYIYIFG